MKLSKVIAAAFISTVLAAGTAFAEADVLVNQDSPETQQNKAFIKLIKGHGKDKDLKKDGDLKKDNNKDSKQEKDEKFKNDGKLKDDKGSCEKCKDPLQILQHRKELVQKALEEGKITKQEADAITARIDEKIKEIEEFNKLDLPQKKEKLMSKFKAFVEQGVKEGKITEEKKEELIRQFTEKLEKWDGNGYPLIRWKVIESRNPGAVN